MSDDVYVQAYHFGGLNAVNAIIKRLPTDEDRVRVMEDILKTQDCGKSSSTTPPGMDKDTGKAVL